MQSKRPRILYLTRNCPCGEPFGGQLRTLHMARLLKTCGDLEMALLSLDPPGEEALARTRSEFNLTAAWQMEMVPIRGARHRLHHELNPCFLDTEGWRLRAEDAAALRAMLPRYDVVWVHNLAVANGGRIKIWPRSVLDVDDLRADYHRSAVDCASTVGQRLRAMRQVWLWKRREAALPSRFDILVFCSEQDRARFRERDRTRVIPNGFEVPASPPKRAPADPPRIGFIGAFRYPPNVEGIRWFITEVWPQVKRSSPNARLRLVGARAEPALGRLGQDIDVLGWVEDPAEEIATWSFMVVPIRVGGGTRIKVAEGFARRCPVVATSLGAFGYDVRSGEELLLADAPDDFAGCCRALLAEPGLANKLAERAWLKVREKWTWEAMQPRVAETVDLCLRRASNLRQVGDRVEDT